MSITLTSVTLDPTIAQTYHELIDEEGPVETTFEDIEIDTLDTMLSNLRDEVEDHVKAISIVWEEAGFSVTCSLAKAQAIVSHLDDILRAGNLGSTEIIAFYKQWGEFPSTDTIMYNIDPLGNLNEGNDQVTLGRYALENDLFAPYGTKVHEDIEEFLDLAKVGHYMGGHVYTIDSTTWWQPAL